MKYYLRSDLRYNYKKMWIVNMAIIAILLAICFALIVVISINDRALENNLILNASSYDSQNDSIAEIDVNFISPEMDAKESLYKKSFIKRLGEELKSFVRGEKTEQIKAVFLNAFKTRELEDTGYMISTENFLMNYLSCKYEDNDFSTATNGAELRNEEKSSNTEMYLYLIKYKYKNVDNNDYYCELTTHIQEDEYKDNSLKILTVLSS